MMTELQLPHTNLEATMSVYSAKVIWNCDDSDFVKRRYSRVHQWQFDGGISLPASASPHVVPLPMSSEAAVDPEEAFVAALSSCHMLFFLDFASREKIVVASYTDQVEGVMEKNEHGRIAMTQVTLNPTVVYQGEVPDKNTVTQLHHRAHDSCFLANSVNTQIKVNI